MTSVFQSGGELSELQGKEARRQGGKEARQGESRSCKASITLSQYLFYLFYDYVAG